MPGPLIFNYNKSAGSCPAKLSIPSLLFCHFHKLAGSCHVKLSIPGLLFSVFSNLAGSHPVKSSKTSPLLYGFFYLVGLLMLNPCSIQPAKCLKYQNSRPDKYSNLSNKPIWANLFFLFTIQQVRVCPLFWHFHKLAGSPPANFSTAGLQSFIYIVLIFSLTSIKSYCIMEVELF